MESFSIFLQFGSGLHWEWDRVLREGCFLKRAFPSERAAYSIGKLACWAAFKIAFRLVNALVGSRFTTLMPPSVLSTTILGFDCLSMWIKRAIALTRVFHVENLLNLSVPKPLSPIWVQQLRMSCLTLDVVFWTDKFIGFLLSSARMCKVWKGTMVPWAMPNHWVEMRQLL